MVNSGLKQRPPGGSARIRSVLAKASACTRHVTLRALYIIMSEWLSGRHGRGLAVRAGFNRAEFSLPDLS